ncbi:Os06g0559900 [Oryza sativa Japonica Group]|uniref:Os06g0559900 protein n=2 Tax=Oryza sativa subsp. japonica TaxID=39947 RepID=Q0DBJ1_ORYSJ|nr:hypothetical protein EE612_034814 [Oryza sativa]BAF19782.1 Os06g0559900 [Oryza sativa Japonica Group]BAS98245.1 Os06g0559900 [Oryza sativa Japonica Group]|eukprot:NP_001057868.1 Os06g0559900 [Oryza sativa Japonica Group]
MDCSEFCTPPTTHRSLSGTPSCISCITARSNIHSPSRDAATPPISIHADANGAAPPAQTEATQTRRQHHCAQMDQRPARSVDTRACAAGYTHVAAMPTAALTPRARLITYAGIPSQSSVAVISVPKLSTVK